MPFLVTVPEVVPIMLARLLAGAVPSRVNPNVAPVMMPVFDSTMSPLFAIMLLSLPSVINPLKVTAVAELLVKAPAPPAPVPLSVKGSAVPSENPFRSRVAPEATIVPASVVPNGVFVAPPAAPSISVPSLIIVSPV